MKYLLSTLCLSLISTSFLWGQVDEGSDSPAAAECSSNYDYGQLNLVRGRNSVELGIGSPEFIADFMGVTMFDDPCCYEPHAYEWFDNQYLQSREMCTLAISGNYMRSLSWWIQMGVSFSAAVYKAEYQKGLSHADAFTERSTIVTCVPTVRFNYRHRRYFGLYSEVGVGFEMEKHRNYHYRYSYRPSKESDFGFMGQLTFIGVRVGSKLYAFGEFGVGPKGLFNGGVGYRF